MLLELNRIKVPPGGRVLFNLDWHEFERILEELGEHRHTRIAYQNGVLEIMVPLPEHEADKESISDFVKALLEELEIDFWSLGSTTFKNQQMLAGIEPDQCFYIQNEAKVRGKPRLDLTLDPPPDLALEVDVTSRTHPSIYEALGVPELWRFEKQQLQINILRNGKYERSQHSTVLPDLPYIETFPTFIQQSRINGRNATMKAFRQWVREWVRDMHS
jgi:Uma2 family endonuclease